MKTTLTFDDDDCELDKNSHLNGPKLALCIWLIKERCHSDWENSEKGGVLEKLIEDVNDIVEKTIGSIDDYTE